MTRLQNLNAYLNERLMVAAREILEVVGNTISEYQKETARTIKENEELRRRLREIGVQANLEFLDGGHHVAPPVSIGVAPQSQQPHEQQCNSGLEEDREPQQTDIKQEFPEQHESQPEQGVVDLNKQASALMCTENPSEHRFLQPSLLFEEKTEEVGCLPHMLPDQIKSEPDELDYSIQKQSITSQPLNRVNNNSNTAESKNFAERNWMDRGGVMPVVEPNEQDSSREMDTRTFYGKRPCPKRAMVPENLALSDAEGCSDSDDDRITDPDFHPTLAHHSDADDFTSLDEDEDQDAEPLPPPKKKKITNKGKNCLKAVSMTEPEEECKLDHRRSPWKKQDIELMHVPDSTFDPPDEIETSLQYFKKMFTDKMGQHISNHTNLYSAQKFGDPIKTTSHEIESFLAILLYMGVFECPSIDNHWHHLSRYSLVADIMPVKRFKLLHKLVHFADSEQCEGSQDRFYKIRPLFEMLRKQCLLIPSTYRQSVDEVMVAYKGTRAGNLRQYIANKPDKWGFKVFCRASSCGIVHDLLLYQGKSTFFNVELSEEEQMLLLGAKVVTSLCKTIAAPLLSVMFCDNYFTSFGLFQRLKSTLGISCTGGAPLIPDKELVKEGRGACDYRSSGGMIPVKWVDSRKLINKPRIGRPPSSSPPAEEPKSSNARSSQPTPDVRFDNVAHSPL